LNKASQLSPCEIFHCEQVMKWNLQKVPIRSLQEVLIPSWGFFCFVPQFQSQFTVTA
jgi:hypothetical protein